MTSGTRGTSPRIRGNSPLVGQPSPHRVRSVRYRLAARTSIADRTTPFTDQPTHFTTRYCMQNVSLADCKRLARVRVVSSEVALVNQGTMGF